MGSEVDNEVPEFTDTGAVFTFGASGFADNLPSHFFIRNDPIIDMACGEEHTMVVCENGRLFGFGGNEFGQVGLGHRTPVVKPSCVKSLKPEKVRLIACGRHHSIAYTESNNLFGWGCDSDGQLGIGEKEVGEDKLISTRCDLVIELKNYIKQLAAGSAHSVALTNDGNVYVWGSNQKGQLGLGEGVKKLRSPSLLPIKENIVQIACGLYHTLLLSDLGQIFVFGEGGSGKLGLGGNNSVPFPIPLSIEDLSGRVISISAGGNYSMALIDDGRVYGWGENEQEQLGFPREEHKQIIRPTAVTSLSSVNVKQIVCGQHHTAFVSDKNELYTCGDMHYGKLCSEGEVESESSKVRCTLPFKVSKFKGMKVDKVACGGKHTMVLASPEKYTNNIIPNGFSDHVNISSIDHLNNKNLHSSNLELPTDRELISPPPAKTIQSPLMIPVTQDRKKSAESNNRFPNSPSYKTPSPLPNKKSSLNPSPDHTRKSNHTTEDKNDVESMNHVEIDSISEDSLSSISKTDETVSRRNNLKNHDSFNYDRESEDDNNCVNCFDNSGKNSPPISKQKNNFFPQTLNPKVIYKDKQVHHKFCYSMKPDTTLNDEKDENNSIKYFYRNRNTGDMDDEIDEFNDFDCCDNDISDDEKNSGCRTNRNNDKNIYKYKKKFCPNEGYNNNKDNRIEDFDAIEEVKEEDNDIYAGGCSSRNNDTYCKYDNSNFSNDWNNVRRARGLNSCIEQCLLHNNQPPPRIICWYEQDQSRFCCDEDCKKRQNMKWFKDHDLKRIEEQKQRRKVIEHWLEENEFKERRRDRKENRIKIRHDKAHRNSAEARNYGCGDYCNRGVGKGGGNGLRGGIIGHLQKHSSFFQFKSISSKKNKNDHIEFSTVRATNLDSSKTTSQNCQNQNSALKEAQSDSMVTRIFGHKRMTKNNNSEPTENKKNGSSSVLRDEDCSESVKAGKLSPIERRNHHRMNVPANGTSRGHQKNSRMCTML